MNGCGLIPRLALVVALGLGLLPALGTDAQEERVPATELIRSVVKIYPLLCNVPPPPADGSRATVPAGTDCQVAGSGSGTIIDPSGRVLTNDHVVHPDRHGFDVDPSKLGWYVVALTVDDQELPVNSYFATPVAFDAELDLAVLEPSYALDGRPLAAGDLNERPIPFGEPDSVELEDTLRILGYPGSGGPLITASTVQVVGFDFDDTVSELKIGWIRTDVAASGPGVSGGSAVNDAGQLVGVPSAGSLNPLNCIDFDNSGDFDPSFECGSGAGGSQLSRPVPEAYDLLLERAANRAPAPAPTPEPDDTPAPAPSDDTVIVTGSIVVADTGAPVVDGFVVVLQPGVKVTDYKAGGTAGDVFTWTVSGADGTFQLPDPVQRDQGYGMLVFADGYEDLAKDNKVLATAADPATVSLPPIPMLARR